MAPRRYIPPIRHTVLVVVEGDTEFAFCRHLKAHLSRGKGIEIHIHNAHGGAPTKIVEFAKQRAKQASYDDVVIVFDTDLALTPTGKRSAESIKAKLFRFTPCIEAWFLNLLGEHHPSDTPSCKKRFHEVGLDEKAKCEREQYDSIFPKTLFDDLVKNPQFSELLQIFSNRHS